MAVPVLAAAPDPGRLNEEAVALTARGRYEEAAALLAQALRLSPGDEVLRRNLARLRTVLGHRFLQAGQTERAREAYEAALELAPEETAALLGLGDVQLRQREPRAAAESYRRAIGVAPRDPEGYLRLGEAYYNQGDLDGALAEWGRALALRPQDSRLWERIQAVEREARVQGRYRSREGQHFTVVYEGTPREDLGRVLLQILERAYADVGYALGAYPPHEVQTIFYSDVDFAAATGYSAGVGGFYHYLDGKIRIALKGLQPDDSRLVPVLYHEYTHALVYAITRGNNPPRWVHEGLAVYLEKRRGPEFRQEAVRQARAGVIPPLEASPYVHGFVAMEYLIDRHGMPTLQELLRRLGDGQSFPAAFQQTVRMDLGAFQQAIRDLLTRGY